MRQLIIHLAVLVAALSVAVGASAEGRETYPLNEGWRFFFKSDNGSDRALHVTLPHSWNTDPLADGGFLETTGNYINELHIPAEWASRRVFVRFRGVTTTADLFVNGRFAGQHRGSGVAFTYELTDKLKFGAVNSLLMVVSNSYRDDTLPTSTDINLYGGITRPVELIVTPKTAVSPLYFGSEGVLVRPTSVSAGRVEGTVEVHVTSNGESAAKLTLDIASQDGAVRFSRQLRPKLDGRPVVVPFAVENPELWSPSSPALYTVRVRLGEGEEADCVEVRTGFRSVAVSAVDGFSVNGVRTPVNGVTLYHDNRTAVGTLSAEDYDTDLAMVGDMGANAIRSAVMPHDGYLYDRCDELGIMAWVDVPFHRSPFFGDVAYYATPAFEENAMQLLQEIVAQNINHPSVVMWGLFSRLWQRGDDPLALVHRMNDAAKRLDPTRPTVACSDQDGGINFVTDLIVWYQNIGWLRGSTDDVVVWRDLLKGNWSHLRSAVTYGAGGFRSHDSDATHQAPDFNRMPEHGQTRLHEEYAKNLDGDSLFWGRWVANMFDYGSARRPYGVNGAGLVTIDRRTRKDAYWLYRAMWNRRAKTLHLVERHRDIRDEGLATLKFYSSEGAPLVMLDADTLTVREYAPCQYRADSVNLTRGNRTLRFSAGGLRDSVTLRIGNDLRGRRTPVLRRTEGLQKTN